MTCKWLEMVSMIVETLCRGKTKDLTPQKISGVKTLINTESYSNQEICRTLKISESSVR